MPYRKMPSACGATSNPLPCLIFLWPLIKFLPGRACWRWIRPHPASLPTPNFFLSCSPPAKPSSHSAPPSPRWRPAQPHTCLSISVARNTGNVPFLPDSRGPGWLFFQDESLPAEVCTACALPWGKVHVLFLGAGEGDGGNGSKIRRSKRPPICYGSATCQLQWG